MDEGVARVVRIGLQGDRLTIPPHRLLLVIAVGTSLGASGCIMFLFVAREKPQRNRGRRSLCGETPHW